MMKLCIKAGLVAAVLTAPTLSVAEMPVATPTPLHGEHRADIDRRADADNSRVNKLNEGRARMTADQQGMSDSATKLTQQIRASLTEREDLSTYARNVKIITDNEGFVTLRGPVNSEYEKSLINDVAVKFAGAGKVKNEISLATK